MPLRRGVGDHFQAMPPESTSVPLRPRPSRVADHLPDPAATSNPFKLIERRLRVLRRQIEYQLACRRLRIGASKVRPAAIAAAYEASPPLDVIGICSEEGSPAVDRVIAFLHRLRDQQLAVGSVRLVASDAVLEDLRQQIAGTLVRPADGRTLLVSGISVDTSATNLLRPLQAAVSASCSQMLAVCDVAGVWDSGMKTHRSGWRPPAPFTPRQRPSLPTTSTWPPTARCAPITSQISPGRIFSPDPSLAR